MGLINMFSAQLIKENQLVREKLLDSKILLYIKWNLYNLFDYI